MALLSLLGPMVWRRMDIMAYAILLKLCSTEDTAHMMESGVFYGMKFTMGLIKRHSSQENLCGALR